MKGGVNVVKRKYTIHCSCNTHTHTDAEDGLEGNTKMERKFVKLQKEKRRW